MERKTSENVVSKETFENRIDLERVCLFFHDVYSRPENIDKVLKIRFEEDYTDYETTTIIIYEIIEETDEQFKERIKREIKILKNLNYLHDTTINKKIKELETRNNQIKELEKILKTL